MLNELPWQDAIHCRLSSGDATFWVEPPPRVSSIGLCLGELQTYHEGIGELQTYHEGIRELQTFHEE